MALQFPFKKPLSDSSSLKDKPDPDYEFQQAINLFISQRQKLKFSIEALSTKTKSSAVILEAEVFHSISQY